MPARLFPALIVVCLISVAPLLSAQSQRISTVIVELDDGSRFEGRAAKKGRTKATYETALGRRTVTRERIRGEEPSAALHERWARMKKAVDEDDLDGRFAIATWAHGAGLTSAVAAESDGVLERDPVHAGVWRIITEQAPHYLITERNSSPPDSGRWVRKQIDLLYRTARKTDFIGAAMVRAQLDAVPLPLQMSQAMTLSKRGTDPQRWVATQVLKRSREARRVKTLYRIALGDAVWQVRRVAVDSLAAGDDGTTFRPFVRTLLGHGDARVRLHAADALGHLGDARGVAPLVKALRAAGDPRAPHNNTSTISQVAYVKDYDVEVAQTAFIADPVVDIVIDGLVLDVAVLSVSAQRSGIARALRRLTGENLGPSPKRWLSWWKERPSLEKSSGASPR